MRQRSSCLGHILLVLLVAVVQAENVTISCDTSAEESSFALPFPFDYVMIAILVCFSALFSGLTLGLLGLDKIGLEIIIAGDDPELAKCAKAIAPVRSNGNLLLCTLLLGNVAVNALLSILMANMTSGLVGFLVSTFMIVIFGEIIPQATCSRYALQIGRLSLPIVKAFIAMLFIICKPLSMILDKALGEEIGTIHSRTELRKMLEIHVQHHAVDVESGKVMDGALKYRDMLVSEVMTEAKSVFMLCVDEKLDYHTLSKIFKGGYSRIPIYDKNRSDIVGLILAKDLIFIDPDDETPLRNFLSLFGRPVQSVWPDQKLGDVLAVFKQTRGHMALVVDVNNESTTEDPHYELVGIITLEDIMEEILGEELLDETDFDEAEMSGFYPGVETDKRERELARLKMLSGKMADERLTQEEVQAITSHLTSNVPQFQRLLSGTSVLGSKAVSVDAIRHMVSNHCKVIEIRRKSDQDAVLRLTPCSEDVLYRRNKPSNVCTLILNGRVTILAGKDNFRSELGPWSLLGADSLEQEDGAYLPDYTAFVSSESLRCMFITTANLRLCWQDSDGEADIAEFNRKRKDRFRGRSSSRERDAGRGAGPVGLDVSSGKARTRLGGYGQLSLEEDGPSQGVELPVKRADSVANPLTRLRSSSN